MDSLVSLILADTLEETIVRVVVFLAICEFIGFIFYLIGRVK